MTLWRCNSLVSGWPYPLWPRLGGTWAPRLPTSHSSRPTHPQQAGGGCEAICVPPLSRAGVHSPCDAIQCPRDRLPNISNFRSMLPAGGRLFGRNGLHVPPTHPHPGEDLAHVEGDGQAPQVGDAHVHCGPPPRVAALGRYNRGPAMCNRVPC